MLSSIKEITTKRPNQKILRMVVLGECNQWQEQENQEMAVLTKSSVSFITLLHAFFWIKVNRCYIGNQNKDKKQHEVTKMGGG